MSNVPTAEQALLELLGNDRKIPAESDDLLKSFTLLSNGNPSVYQLPTKPTVISEEYHLRRSETIVDSGQQVAGEMAEKIVLLVGATGTGKTTLINAMVNQVLQVRWGDKFRFKLIDAEAEGGATEAASQTKWITAYSLVLPGLPYKLTLVDTPGFGDTAGVQRDQRLVEQIRQLLSPARPDGIKHVNAICFVVQSSAARLTDFQRYVFDSVLLLFARDLAEHIFVLATFSDAAHPPVAAALADAKVDYVRPILKINNSAFFAQFDSKFAAFDEQFWKVGVESLRTLLERLNKCENVSLRLTNEVLAERANLEDQLRILENQLQVALSKVDQVASGEAANSIYAKQSLVAAQPSATTKAKPSNYPQRAASESALNEIGHRKHSGDKGKQKKLSKVKQFMRAIRSRARSTKEDKSENAAAIAQLQATPEVGQSACEPIAPATASVRGRIDQQVQSTLQQICQINNRLREVALKRPALELDELVESYAQAEEQTKRPGWKARAAHLRGYKSEQTAL